MAEIDEIFSVVGFNSKAHILIQAAEFNINFDIIDQKIKKMGKGTKNIADGID